jgi:hypothetical protein
VKKLLSLFLLSSFILAYPKSAHAIIFLPAIILIPIAKIVALVIGGFTLPSLGLGVLWSKLFGNSLLRSLTFIVIFLIAGGILLALFLHSENPNRPLF